MVMPDNSAARRRLPDWAKKRLARPERVRGMKAILRRRGLHTVCESARCPNMGECFGKPTATFMILGDVCTRGCGFCSIDKTKAPCVPDVDEPRNIALAAKEMGLRHVVVTSVTRDDLADGGARQFAMTIRALRDELPAATIEVLTPDFKGDWSALSIVLDARPDIFNHNVETVERLYPIVRPQADYHGSLSVLRQAKATGVMTKSGIMVGFGETDEEVKQTLDALKDALCDAITIGQYLQPTRLNLPVKEYVRPEVFEKYEAYGRSIGLKHVYSGTFVRSSYNAERLAEGG
ncbi:MAG: lipoyl synthase [Deltaproteobacteria bacterium]|nr:lipoyl synthase [Deltaproteobacteria bacterium]